VLSLVCLLAALLANLWEEVVWLWCLVKAVTMALWGEIIANMARPLWHASGEPEPTLLGLRSGRPAASVADAGSCESVCCPA
jgi:hypothetical protein